MCLIDDIQSSFNEDAFDARRSLSSLPHESCHLLLRVCEYFFVLFVFFRDEFFPSLPSSFSVSSVPSWFILLIDQHKTRYLVAAQGHAMIGRYGLVP